MVVARDRVTSAATYVGGGNLGNGSSFYHDRDLKSVEQRSAAEEYRFILHPRVLSGLRMHDFCNLVLFINNGPHLYHTSNAKY